MLKCLFAKVPAQTEREQITGERLGKIRLSALRRAAIAAVKNGCFGVPLILVLAFASCEDTVSTPKTAVVPPVVEEPIVEPVELKALGLSAGTLVPGFSSAIYEYTAELPYDVGSLTVTAEATGTVTVKFNGIETDGSGALNEGENIITVEIASAESAASSVKEKKTYTITALRLDAFGMGEAKTAPSLIPGAEEGDLRVIWRRVPGAAGYAVFYDTDGDAAETEFAPVTVDAEGKEVTPEEASPVNAAIGNAPAEIEIVLKGLSVEFSYTVLVKALNANGEGKFLPPANGNTKIATFTGLPLLAKYLEDKPENTAEAPYRVALAGLNIDNFGVNGTFMSDLYSAFNGRFVALDLSGCTGENLADRPAKDTDKLVEIILPDTLARIEGGVFGGSTNLKSVSLPASARDIDKAAFSNEVLFTVRGSGRYSTDASGRMLLRDDGSILAAYPAPPARVVIPEGVSVIPKEFFQDNRDIQHAELPKTLSRIEDRLFYGCTSLAVVKIGKDAAVTGIGDDVFRNCVTLVEVTIPDAVKSIGDRAFSDCLLLPVITVPKNVTTIGVSVFERCEALIKADVLSPVIGKSMFFHASNLAMAELSDSITVIPEMAFKECRKLTRVNIPSSLKSIAKEAFSTCTILAIDLNLPQGLEAVGDGAFRGCAIKSLSVPASVKSIGGSAFNGCGNIAGEIGLQSVEVIGGSAFSGCGKITAITLSPYVDIANKDALPASGELVRINMDGEGRFRTISDGSMLIKGNEAFYLCPNATGDIELPDGIDEVAAGYFKGKAGITSVTLPSTVKTIGENAFQNCTGLVSVTLTAGITSIKSIERYTFDGCSSLAEIVLPDTVTEIKNYAFQNCSGLTEIELPDAVETIGNLAFSGCSNLERITMPATISSIQLSDITQLSFLNCTNLKFNITGNGKYSDACEGMLLLENNIVVASPAASGIIVIPEGVTSIAANGFYKNNAVTSITLPLTFAGVTLPTYAIRECKGLAEIIALPETPPNQLSTNSFLWQSCNGGYTTDIKVYVPDGTKTDYENAGWVRNTSSNRLLITLLEMSEYPTETETQE
jgi:hypothetical protein